MLIAERKSFDAGSILAERTSPMGRWARGQGRAAVGRIVKLLRCDSY